MNYELLITTIRNLHGTSLERVARAVNQSLVLRNWLIGA